MYSPFFLHTTAPFPNDVANAVRRQMENPDEDCYSASGYQSTTESLASSVFNYIYENGDSFPAIVSFRCVRS